MTKAEFVVFIVFLVGFLVTLFGRLVTVKKQLEARAFVADRAFWTWVILHIVCNLGLAYLVDGIGKIVYIFLVGLCIFMTYAHRDQIRHLMRMQVIIDELDAFSARMSERTAAVQQRSAELNAAFEEKFGPPSDSPSEPPSLNP